MSKKVTDVEKLCCSMNKNVICSDSGEICKHCGWNPAVAEARLEKIQQKMKGSK